MSNVHKPATAGKDTDPSVNPLAEILATIRELKTRFNILEERFEYLDRDVLKAIDAESIAVTDAERDPPRIPSLALTSDGRVLISLHYVEGADLEDRETWTGIFLSEAESCDILDATSDGADDAAAHVGGRLISKAKKNKSEGSDDDG